MKLKNLLVAFVSALFLLAAGDPKSGESKVAVCSACHGADGNSVVGLWPSLAGQNEKYLLKQLRLVKSGDRVIDSMVGLLDNLDDSDLEDISARNIALKNVERYLSSKMIHFFKPEQEEVLGALLHPGHYNER